MDNDKEMIRELKAIIYLKDSVQELLQTQQAQLTDAIKIVYFGIKNLQPSVRYMFIIPTLHNRDQDCDPLL